MADYGSQEDTFGSMRSTAGDTPAAAEGSGTPRQSSVPAQPFPVQPSIPRVPQPQRDEVGSVVGDDVGAGGTNITGGLVVRNKRRKFRPHVSANATRTVPRDYNVVGGILFNNLDEIYQDRVSPEEAQEIVEEALVAWGVDVQNEPAANKYCEDLIFAFIITVSASDKGNWNVAYPIVLADGQEKDADFSVLHNLITSVHGATRRRFARGLADRIRAYLKHPDNIHLRGELATYVGCDEQMADLAFDGSTHCKGLVPKERQFTQTLMDRNLFERFDEMAQGASQRLMNTAALGGGVRAVR